MDRPHCCSRWDTRRDLRTTWSRHAPATTEEYEALEIPRDVPVLEIFHRRLYSDDDKPIEVTLLTKPHRFKMGYHIEMP